MTLDISALFFDRYAFVSNIAEVAAALHLCSRFPKPLFHAALKTRDLLGSLDN